MAGCFAVVQQKALPLGWFAGGVGFCLVVGVVLARGKPCLEAGAGSTLCAAFGR